MDWRFFIPILILTVFDWVLTGYRISIFTSRISSKVKFWDCFKAGIAGTFIATITPSQMGGWMGQLYILYRAGLPWSGGTVIIVITFLSTLISLFFSVLFVIVFYPQLFNEKIVIIMQYSFIVFCIALVGFILLLVKPDLIQKILYKLSISRFVNQNHRIHKFFQNMMIKLENLTSEYKKFTKLFIKQKTLIIFFSVLVTFIMYFNRALIAYFIIRSLKDQAKFWNVVFVQILLIFIGYFSPTPGASGVSELSSALLMSPIMTQGNVFLFTTIWRFTNSYLELFVGGIIMVIQLRRDILQNPEPQIGRFKD
ncbi:MAG: glycosyltransferase 2 family protein [Candidatus Poribacteria bacterium]|nr:glycosyltransferase 2 family protein [Candidatus Poribacteria bacterium]